MNIEKDVKLAKKGNRDAFTRLIKHSETTLYRVAKSILKSDTECADAIQETILKAFNGIKTLREPVYFKTWLIRILMNECKQILRINNKVVPMQEIMTLPNLIDDYKQFEIRDAVNSLEEELRILVVLFYFEDLPVKDIAILLDMPEGTVKTRLYRARAKLGELLNIKVERSVGNEGEQFRS